MAGSARPGTGKDTQLAALLLGSIGVLAETSELQRAAFNAAFAEAGLDWHWSQAHYATLLAQSGGHDRIAAEAARRDETVDVAACTPAKAPCSSRNWPWRAAAPRRGRNDACGAQRWRRPGVGDDDQRCQCDGGSGRHRAVDRSDFDLVLTRADVARAKPDPEVYLRALDVLGHPQTHAVEDNPDGLRAALGAGLPCTAFPGEMHAAAEFDGAAAIIQSLSLPGHLARDAST